MINFFAGSQIASPKSRQQMKQPPPQPSPTAHSKYMYGGMSSQQGGQQVGLRFVCVCSANTLKSSNNTMY